MWQSPLVVVTVAAVAIGLVLVLFARPSTPVPGGTLTEPTTVYPAALIDGQNLGAKTAPVTIQIYADFQCPACRAFAMTEVARLITDFVTPGTVRLEAHDIDILGSGQPDESLELAAGARCAAAQGRYWQFHDLVFWNQGRENRGDHDTAFIQSVATAAEVDRTNWDACFADPSTRTPIRNETRAAVGLGINQTPTLLVNGQRIVGVPAYDNLAAMIRGLAASAAPGASATP